jgi:hypothetical protein
MTSLEITTTAAFDYTSEEIDAKQSIYLYQVIGGSPDRSETKRIGLDWIGLRALTLTTVVSKLRLSRRSRLQTFDTAHAAGLPFLSYQTQTKAPEGINQHYASS